MSEALIPFALDTNDCLVEVFDVAGGKRCSCRCPFCRQGVIARHGKQKVWHFAHDPNADAKPVQACELSFFSCCRLYLIERALAGQLAKLALPELTIEDHIGKHRRIQKKALVTKAREIEIGKYGNDGPYDLEARLGDYTLALHIQYPDRMPPDIPSDEATGLLSVDITPLEALYRRTTGRKERILPLLKSLLEGSSEWPGSIEWQYHPRTEAARATLRQELIQEFDPALELPTLKADFQQHLSATPSQPVKAPPVLEKQKGAKGVFRCLKCHSRWEGHQFLDATCSTCQTHLYSQFQEAS